MLNGNFCIFQSFAGSTDLRRVDSYEPISRTHKKKNLKRVSLLLKLVNVNAYYSRVPNKRTGRLLENERDPTYTHFFRPIHLLIFSKKSHLYSDYVQMTQAHDWTIL